MSGVRPPGVPTSVTPSPQVQLITPPPVGFPLWVVIAVGVGAFVVGLVIGAVAL
ncbi:MAG: hypothetical protein U0414_22880 [Polyangiaceae bacterium]